MKLVAGEGRPFRALAALGLALIAWLAWRAPQLAADSRRLAIRLATGPRTGMLASAPLITRPPTLLRSLPAAGERPLRPSEPARLAGPLLSPQPSPDLPPAPVMAPPPSTVPSTGPSPALADPFAASSAALSTGQPARAAPATAFALADQAYRQLAAGERRQAARLFTAALALEPGNRQWQADRRALTRRWQAGGFALLRDGGPPFNAPGTGLPGFAGGPVLGGGQLGASLAFLPDPLARRPLAIVARVNVAADVAGVRQETALAAIGVRQALLPGVTLSAERLLALGVQARGDWTLRLAAGQSRGRLAAYGEAGVLGSGQAYGGAQATARLLRLGPAALAAGAWASGQTGSGSGSPNVWRVDVGPSVSAGWQGIRLQADWRERVAGNALPGSGPVVTVSAGF